MTVKITSFEAENVKRIKAVQLEPSPNGLTIIGGRNNQGKTSVLDAIAWGLGGNKLKPSDPHRAGSVQDPEIKITLSNGLIVERRGKNSDLKVTDPTGKKSGQKILDSLIGEMALNIPKFMEATPKEKADYLLRIIGIGDQLADMEREETNLFNQRAFVGRQARAKKAHADEMTEYCRDRKTIAFLPLIATSRKFKEILNRKGFHAEEISGTDFPETRQRKLRDFEEGRTNVLCNSMLLTEGFDCPSIDCVICLRPTKIRALYTQIVGRGTRLAPGKEYVLLLDFLWHSERMELCHPAHLISDDAKVQKRMTEILEDKAHDPMLIEGLDIQELEVEAESDVVRQREAALAEHLRELKTRKSKFVDPLQWEMSISSNDLASYEETFAWELKPMTDKQKASLEKWGINPDEVETCGKARLILDKLQKRREAGLTTPKQIRMLERKGFQRVGEWQFSEASKLIDEIAQNGWRVPYSFGRPADYVPLSMRSKASTPAPQSGWQTRAHTAINW